MIRISVIGLFLLSGKIAFAQQPFNYGKSKNTWFFSKREIVKTGIKELVMPSIPADGNKNAEEAYLTVISYADTSNITEGWFPYYGTSTKRLTIRQLRDSVDFMNGSFYLTDESGKIMAGGAEGKGALCQKGYEHDSLYTLAIEYCKYAPTTTANKIYYYPNGLPKFSVCCKTDSSNVEIENPDEYADSTVAVDSLPSEVEEEYDSFFKKNDRTWHYTDTTWYVYDDKWRVTGTRTREKGFEKIFTTMPNYQSQWYINNTRFEIFIDKKIGYRPRLIFFEIYRNAVFVFRYNEKKKKYYHNETIELE